MEQVERRILSAASVQQERELACFSYKRLLYFFLRTRSPALPFSKLSCHGDNPPPVQRQVGQHQEAQGYPARVMDHRDILETDHMAGKPGDLEKGGHFDDAGEEAEDKCNDETDINAIFQVRTPHNGMMC